MNWYGDMTACGDFGHYSELARGLANEYIVLTVLAHKFNLAGWVILWLLQDILSPSNSCQTNCYVSELALSSPSG